MGQLSYLFTREIEVIAEDLSPDQGFWSKHKVISALFPYAVHLAQDGQRGMFDAILRVALKSRSGEFMWYHIGRYTTTLFDESSPPFPNQAIILAAPCVPWGNGTYFEKAAARWASAVLATPFCEEVGQSVVDALLRISQWDTLRPHIPIGIFAWLKRQPFLPYRRKGLGYPPGSGVIRYIRCLGDIEILKSYFLLIWSHWYILSEWQANDTQVSLGEDFRGITMQHHRKDLTERLGYILKQLDQELMESPKDAYYTKNSILLARRRYRPLLATLEEEDRKSMNPTSVCLQSQSFVMCILIITYRILLDRHLCLASSEISLSSEVHGQYYAMSHGGP